eukprot:CAMPEP_0198210756 /NCGR_PEP_ID=MMETSP1445-20131203/22180_1 /TAXON_ID=36898 /ORGANISM="Pyramimonas sp., Strain CCMP2087" /LENGTH=236 /DNA_ID=CAMNT_0043884897 /DNA_START=146 /DNA_END=853 /DNA_ORIENTATION=-
MCPQALVQSIASPSTNRTLLTRKSHAPCLGFAGERERSRMLARKSTQLSPHPFPLKSVRKIEDGRLAVSLARSFLCVCSSWKRDATLGGMTSDLLPFEVLRSHLDALRIMDVESASAQLSQESGLGPAETFRGRLKNPSIMMLLGNCRSELLGSLKVSEGEHSFRILVSGFEPVGIERAMGSAQGIFTFGLCKYSDSKSTTNTTKTTNTTNTNVAHKYTFTFGIRKELNNQNDGGW